MYGAPPYPKFRSSDTLSPLFPGPGVWGARNVVCLPSVRRAQKTLQNSDKTPICESCVAIRTPPEVASRNFGSAPGHLVPSVLGPRDFSGAKTAIFLAVCWVRATVQKTPPISEKTPIFEKSADRRTVPFDMPVHVCMASPGLFGLDRKKERKNERNTGPHWEASKGRAS